MAAAAIFKVAASTLRGLPPILPLARAAAKPASLSSAQTETLLMFWMAFCITKAT